MDYEHYRIFPFHHRTVDITPMGEITEIVMEDCSGVFRIPKGQILRPNESRIVYDPITEAEYETLLEFGIPDFSDPIYKPDDLPVTQ